MCKKKKFDEAEISYLVATDPIPIVNDGDSNLINLTHFKMEWNNVGGIKNNFHRTQVYTIH